MDRLVLDTNIIVSALLTPGGKPARVLDQVLSGNAVLCHDAEIITEYQEVMCRKEFAFNPGDIHILIIRLIKKGVSITAAPAAVPFTDESDRKFFETAKSCGAFLVTGNIKHFPVESWIMTPAEYLESLYR
ncbi:PIN domain-containing protein [Spirochaetia bacterium]|nr:PIN domain-containing protein [Spirochaetia bacterium]